MSHRGDRPVKQPRARQPLPREKFRRYLTLILAIGTVYQGVIYVGGGAATATSLVAMAGIQPFPMLGGIRAWGGLMMLAGLLLIAKRYAEGFGIASLIWLTWAGCAIGAVWNNTSSAGGAPGSLGMVAAIHVLCLYSHRANGWRSLN